MNEGQFATSEFIKTFIQKNPINSSLKVKESHLKTIDPNIPFDVKANNIQQIKKSYDFIFGAYSFGKKSQSFELSKNKKFPFTWIKIYDSLKHLNPTGMGFFVVEPLLLYSKMGDHFMGKLEEQGFYLNMVLNIPEGIYIPHSAFTPILIGMSRKNSEKLFIAELNSMNAEDVNYNFSHQSGDNLDEGIWVHRDFKSFKNYKILSQIRNLKSQYKEYEEYKFSEIALEINTTEDLFEEKDNAIFIPKFGSSDVASNNSGFILKPKHYFQIILNSNIVDAEYLYLFFQSELGQLIMSSMESGNMIPSRKRNEVLESYVAIPELSEQKLLVNTSLKLDELREVIDDLKVELSLNPKNVNVINEKFDSIKVSLQSLSKEDEILSLIRKGEGKTIEFKETFSKNIRTGKKDKEIEKSSLKNIVGFLNSNGGTLIVGVSDEGVVKGVAEDFFQSKDRYLLHFKNALNSKIGSEFYPLIDYDLYDVLGQILLVVECQPSEEACFYDNQDFYIRTNPATDKLEGPKLIEYINRRFKKK
ncbi:Putative DNA-binding domain-containing protein [Salinimicrobium catena]|uniref:Putative DNA-binding domain-containing protein n=1 Tax=Salinimicrobium catena TaxID=390640 RepID=A0A1H5JPB6_9FLAO|nr:RNA-binding domain-containing protein [Salinimicrobium catena]SDL83446.1 Putative DNA-binding domain-containing protein [Salinimicrobium catena]SEE54264.1 Putative DNA-binding domain-containing protein [Salinimicrobium catena]